MSPSPLRPPSPLASSTWASGWGNPNPAAPSLLERCELVECVPEERGLPFGLGQGENLLLGQAGGHSHMALL